MTLNALNSIITVKDATTFSISSNMVKDNASLYIDINLTTATQADLIFNALDINIVGAGFKMPETVTKTADARFTQIIEIPKGADEIEVVCSEVGGVDTIISIGCH